MLDPKRQESKYIMGIARTKRCLVVSQVQIFYSAIFFKFERQKGNSKFRKNFKLYLLEVSE
jgi:hypothetical protein